MTSGYLFHSWRYGLPGRLRCEELEGVFLPARAAPGCCQPELLVHVKLELVQFKLMAIYSTAAAGMDKTTRGDECDSEVFSTWKMTWSKASSCHQRYSIPEPPPASRASLPLPEALFLWRCGGRAAQRRTTLPSDSAALLELPFGDRYLHCAFIQPLVFKKGVGKAPR